MKPNPINTLATWYPMNQEGLIIKAFNAGYPYLQGNLIARSSLKTPVTRYAKNFTKGKKRYSLCIISTEQDTEKMETWLDNQAKNIKAKDITDGFNMLEVKYNA